MDQWPDSDDQNPSKTYALSGKIMLASIISLFILVVFLILLHLYSRWYLHRRNPNPNPNPTQHHPNRSIRILYYNGSASPPPTGGLHTSVLNSLPLFVYSPEKDANSPECAVCLSEFENGEKGRILPNCKHRFHTGCIDMWFFSNSTCPLCRSPVEPVETEMTGLAEPGSSTSFTETRRKRVDVRIDVPDRDESVSESEFRQASPNVALRSPGSRLLSLKRIISMVSPSSSGVGTSCVPVGATESDLESAGQESSRG